MCTVVLTVPADLFIHLVFTSSCSQPAEPADVLTGQIATLIVLLVAALPWLVAVPLSRNSGNGALIGLRRAASGHRVRCLRPQRRCVDEHALSRRLNAAPPP